MSECAPCARDGGSPALYEGSEGSGGSAGRTGTPTRLRAKTFDGPDALSIDRGESGVVFNPLTTPAEGTFRFRPESPLQAEPGDAEERAWAEVPEAARPTAPRSSTLGSLAHVLTAVCTACAASRFPLDVRDPPSDAAALALLPVDLFIWLVLLYDLRRTVALARAPRGRVGGKRAAGASVRWREMCMLTCDVVAAAPIEVLFPIRSVMPRTYEMLKGVRLFKCVRCVRRVLFSADAAASVVTVVLGLGWILHVLTCITQEISVVEIAYSRAFYWTVYTVTSVGYGDTDIGDTRVVHFYASALMLLGLVGSGVFIGKIAEILARQDRTSQDIDQGVQELRSLMEFYSIPRAISEEALSWHEHVLHAHAFDHHAGAIESLPSSLQERISLAARRHLLCAVPLLRGLRIPCLEDLATRMSRVVLDPGETLVTQGDPAADFFLITHGTFDRIKDMHASAAEQEYFCGEFGVLYGTPHPCTVRARGYCDVFGIPATLVIVCCVRYPELLRRLVNAAEGPHAVLTPQMLPQQLNEHPRCGGVRDGPLDLAHDLAVELLRDVADQGTATAMVRDSSMRLRVGMLPVSKGTSKKGLARITTTERRASVDTLRRSDDFDAEEAIGWILKQTRQSMRRLTQDTSEDHHHSFRRSSTRRQTDDLDDASTGTRKRLEAIEKEMGKMRELLETVAGSRSSTSPRAAREDESCPPDSPRAGVSLFSAALAHSSSPRNKKKGLFAPLTTEV
eukprot:TRINITY_DN11698_c0_g1_i1.p1 TRINITY_DN11698_c0_g1~~TRINITY_DN11698_c0_g1_i1.p1  ORF type:complete len:737 (+),score=153.23 TRINITY_DN11698_c0_g1_i1:64-2274(+)